MKTEIWNGIPIRFVEKDSEWWAVLKDVANALQLRTDKVIARLDNNNLSKVAMEDALGRQRRTTIVNELGIYEAVFESRKKEAKEFKRWVYEMLKALRKSTSLEGFQIFRMLDKDHQKEAMAKLKKGLKEPGRPDFIKANTIANKAVSTKYGYPKMVKKGDMTPEMLVDRQDLLDSTVELMGIKEKFSLDLSVSEEVYKLASGQKTDQTA